jgi:hypothetical protein
MSFLNDKVYDNMDDLSVFMRPWILETAKIQDKIPEKIEIPHSYIVERFSEGSDVSAYYAQLFLFDSLKLEIPKLGSLEYSIDILSGSTFNLDTKEFSGKIFLMIERQEINEDTIKALLVTRLRTLDPGRVKNMEKIIKLIDPVVLENNREKINNRGTSAKWETFQILHQTVRKLIEEDLWKIRSDDVYIKLIQWIKDYVSNDSANAWVNIMQLKCMTHNKNPIYSITEVI